MKPSPYKQVIAFLKSTEATASAFSSVGWDVEREKHAHDVWCLVNYGILEEMELNILVEADGRWLVEAYIPPVLPQCEKEAEALCRHIQRTYPPLVATVDTDRSVLLGAVGEGDPTPTLRAMWQAFAMPEVYEIVLLLCGMTAPTDEDVLASEAAAIDCYDNCDAEDDD